MARHPSLRAILLVAPRSLPAAHQMMSVLGMIVHAAKACPGVLASQLENLQVLLDIVRKTGASKVYCQSEATYEEAQIEKQVSSALSTENAQLKMSWSSTLFDIEALPFRLADLPSTHGLFPAPQPIPNGAP